MVDSASFRPDDQSPRPSPVEQTDLLDVKATNGLGSADALAAEYFGQEIAGEPSEPADQNRRFLNRLGDTVRTWSRELVQKDHRLRRFGAFAVGAATQTLDRGRAMIFVLPTTFDEVLAHATERGWNGYQTGTAAGLAVGGVFGAWGYLVGKSLHVSINEFPETTQAVTENHPVMVGVISDAVSGFPSRHEFLEQHPEKPQEGYDVGPYETKKSRLGKMGLAVKRGLKTAFLYGTTAQVGVSKVSEHSDRSTEKRLRVTAAEAGGALAGVAVGVSSLVTHDFLGIAEEVRDTITNKVYLSGASVGFIGLAAVSNYFARKKFAQSHEMTWIPAGVAEEPAV